MAITLSARPIRRILLATATVIALLSLSASLLHPEIRGLTRIVNLNAERSYPNWYSSLGLAVASVFLGVVSWGLLRSKRRDFIAHWLFLSATFALLSADEIIGLHESLNAVMRGLGRFTGYLHFSWVIPVGFGVFLFGLTYLRFLAALPARRRNQFVAAGAIYVLGALGMEMIGGKARELYTRDSTAYVLCYHLEEFFELCGIALFNAALIDHLADLFGPTGLRIRFSKAEE